MDTVNNTTLPKDRLPCSDPGTLKENSLGLFGIVVNVIAMVAPLTAVLGLGPLIFNLVGTGATGAYIIAGITAMIFSVGFVALSRKCTNAGGFASFITLAFGNRAGTSAAYTALFSYNSLLIAVALAAALFFNNFIHNVFGVSLPWQIVAFVILLIIAFVGYRAVDVSMKVLGVLMCCEMLVLIVLDIAIIIQGRAGGFTFEGLTLSNIITPAMPLAFVFAFASFCGFEATIVYGEETRNPKKTIPRAIYIVIILLTLVYSLTTWAIENAYPSGGLQQAISTNFMGFIIDLAATKVCYAWSVIMQGLLVTSFLAATIAIHNVITRYMFAMGRAGVLPSRLGKTHPQSKSPHVASVVQSIISAVLMGICSFEGDNVFSTIYGLSAGLSSLSFITIMAWSCLSTIVIFRRNGRGEERIFNVFIAPLISFIILGANFVLIVMNFGMISGVASWLWILIPMSMAAGFIISFTKKKGSINLAAEFRYL